MANTKAKEDNLCRSNRSRDQEDDSQNMPPQTYLDMMLQERGYSTGQYSTLETGYYAKPTALQQASYNIYLIRLIRAKDTASLKAMLESGLSPNPCNKYGESLIHMICSRGDSNLLKMQLDVGGSVQVSDKCGRTPLHDICRRPEPCFEMAEMIAKKDLGLFQMTDVYDALPLSYVKEEHWSHWNEFLHSNLDRWWPKRDVSFADMDAPELVKAAPDSRPIPDPINALPLELAGMIASGLVAPQDAVLFSYDCSESEAHLLLDGDHSQTEQDLDMAMQHLTNHLNKIKC